MDHYYARIFVLNLPIGVYEMPEVLEAIGFFKSSSLQGGFPDVNQANNAAFQAHDIPYESTLFAPSSPMWESWRCPMRAWTDIDWSRRQSGFPAVHTDRPKSDIDYRFTATTVADRNAATSVLGIRALIAAKLPLVSRYHKMFSLHANTFDFWMN